MINIIKLLKEKYITTDNIIKIFIIEGTENMTKEEAILFLKQCSLSGNIVVHMPKGDT